MEAMEAAGTEAVAAVVTAEAADMGEAVVVEEGEEEACSRCRCPFPYRCLCFAGLEVKVEVATEEVEEEVVTEAEVGVAGGQRRKSS